MFSCRIAPLLALVALLTLAIPASGAVAQEQGATLLADGTTTVMIGGEEVAAAMQREVVVLAGYGFQTGEAISMWVTLPDASVLEIVGVEPRADENGNVVVPIFMGWWLPVGLHHFSARGLSSGRGAIEPFYLLPGTGPEPTSGTAIGVSPATAQQLDVVALTGRGFAAGEDVELWLTMPD